MTTTRQLPAQMQLTLEQISNLLAEGGSVTDVTTALSAQLDALAQAFGIDQAGDQILRPGQRSMLDFVPRVEFPPVSTPKGTFAIVPTAAWQVLDATGNVLRNGKDFHSPDLNDLNLDVLLAPQVVELTKRQLPVRNFGIRVTLTLSMTLPGTLFTPTVDAPQTISGSASIPDRLPLRLSALPLAVPTVLALFRHNNLSARDRGLNGFVLLVVETTSPFGERDLAKLEATLTTLTTASGSLTRALPRLPFAALLGEAGRLADAIAAQPSGFKRLKVAGKEITTDPTVRSIHEIPRLDKIGIPDDSRALDAGNAISSLILLSVDPDLQVECWNGGDFDARAPRFDLDMGPEGFIVVENLAINRTQPVTIPNRRLAVRKKPGALNSFDDGISAIRIRRT